MRKLYTLTRIALLLLLAPATLAQDDTLLSPADLLPTSSYLNGVRYEAQMWNNCGPATLTNALSFFGYQEGQTRAANWLKPNGEDKNVSPDQMVSFVNDQVPEMNVRAMTRYGGTVDTLKRLIANDFPVIVEKGYNPEPDRLGWMGHYLLVTGYDDNVGTFTTHDSYIGPDVTYTYQYLNEMWQHFNYTYIVLYPASRIERLNKILGDDAEAFQNKVNATQRARSEHEANPQDAFALFNYGTSLVLLGQYELAAQAYDNARNIGLPWRMLWYQFGPFEAYYNVGRYNDMIELARANLNDGGGQYVEETFYYGGLAREALGEYDRALTNYNTAIQFNPNFTPAINARDALQSRLNS